MMDKPVTLPGFPAVEATPIDQSHQQERRLFEQMMGDMPWVANYQALLDEGWYWRDAAYIAWFGLPKGARMPATKGELADMLGIGHRALNNRIQRNPAIQIRAAKYVAGRVFDHIDDVMEALVASASNESYKHHPDRKMYLEMAGVYTPRQSLALEEGAKADDMSALSDDELARQARLTAGMDDSDAGDNDHQ